MSFTGSDLEALTWLSGMKHRVDVTRRIGRHPAREENVVNWVVKLRLNMSGKEFKSE